MERVFTELTPEVDVTAQMYAKGKEKKEIAAKKFRELCTINNQIMRAYEILKVRNRSELSLMYAKRIAIKKARLIVIKLNENKKNLSIVIFFLATTTFDGISATIEMRRPRTRNNIRTEWYSRRSKRTKQDREFNIKPLINA